MATFEIYVDFVKFFGLGKSVDRMWAEGTCLPSIRGADVARLIMRVFDSILPARGAPLAELCNVLLLAEADDRKAISQPAQNPSAQPSRAISKFNTEDLGHFTAEQSPENAYEKGIGHLGTGRGIPMLLQSAIVRLCLAVVVIVAASVS